MNAFDTTVFHWINQFAGHHQLIDFVMKCLAKYALEIYALLFVVAWFTLPKKARGERHALVIAGLSGILALLLNVLISSVYFRARPFVTLPHGSFTQILTHPADASFPSDHVAGGAGFAAASWGKNVRWISYTFTILTIVVAFARVYVGVHWPTDVIGGFVVGIIASQIMWRLSRFIYPLTSLALRIFKYE
jgi:undecaprenyl-diphosphatase